MSPGFTTVCGSPIFFLQVSHILPTYFPHISNSTTLVSWTGYPIASVINVDDADLKYITWLHNCVRVAHIFPYPCFCNNISATLFLLHFCYRTLLHLFHGQGYPTASNVDFDDADLNYVPWLHNCVRVVYIFPGGHLAHMHQPTVLHLIPAM